MPKTIIWFLLSCKRYLKRIPFLAVLLLLPASAAFISGAEKGSENAIAVAVCSLDTAPESLGSRLAGSLTDPSQTDADGMFRFYLCTNEDQVRKDVASRKAECGYIIYENLELKLNSRDFKRSIGVISAPSTVTAPLSTEVVFARMIKLYNKTLLHEYVESGSAFSALGEPGSKERKKAAAQGDSLYEQWINSDRTFRFEYTGIESADTGTASAKISDTETSDTASADLRPSSSNGLFPVRGLAAVLVFITGLYSAVVRKEDEKRGLFLALNSRQRPFCRAAALAAPVFLSACFGLLAIFISGESVSLFSETGIMLIYMAAVILFSALLGALPVKPEVLCCAIPFFIIGSLIFCPIFLDSGRLLPSLSHIGKLFLPYYYLNWFV